VDARRADKSFPLESPEIARQLGGAVLKHAQGVRVDVHNPAWRLCVEVRDKAYLYTRFVDGPGGMPTGTGGRIALLLSGGIDSSVVAAAAQSALGKDQPLLTFSIGFEDARYDESEYAAAVARHLGTRHHRFVVRPDAAADLPKLAAVFGEPFADSSALPTHYLAQETRPHVKVALSGDGGDELFGGYDRYQVMKHLARLGPLTRPAGLAIRALSALFPGVHPKSRLAGLKRLGRVLNHPTTAERYAARNPAANSGWCGDRSSISPIHR
jgi:hypothetical protein